MLPETEKSPKQDRKNKKDAKQGEHKKERKKRNLSNQLEIKLTSAFFVLLFAGMMVYLGHFVATSEQDMINNSYNSRQEILLSRNYRGSIFSRDGEVLA